MMLLQAGQAGLYRRDSIWTEEIPPEMVAGCTLWADATDEEKMYTGGYYEHDTGAPIADGVKIKSLRNKITATGGIQDNAYFQHTLARNALNGKNFIAFDAAGQFADTIYMTYNTSTGAFAQPHLSTLVTTSTKLFICAIRVHSASELTGYSYQEAAVFKDTNAYSALVIGDNGTTLTARAVNMTASQESLVDVTIPRSQWIVLSMQHQGGQLRMRFNGGAWTTTPSGNTTSLSSPVVFFDKYNEPYNFKMDWRHLSMFNTAQSDAAISAVERWAANDLGITPWW